MVPSRTPAPSAAMMPTAARPGAALDCVVAKASTAAPPTMAHAPPITLAQSRTREPRSSLNSRHPQKSPTRLLVFHSGKAMARPTLRTAKMVSVLATAHNIPPSSAHTMRCGLSRRSAKTNPVPLSSVGKRPARHKRAHHHAHGDEERRKSLVDQLGGRFSAAQPHRRGQSAKHAELVQGNRRSRAGGHGGIAQTTTSGDSPQGHQQRGSKNQHDHRNPKMNVGEDARQHGFLRVWIMR